jgi:hypothetical protein
VIATPQIFALVVVLIVGTALGYGGLAALLMVTVLGTIITAFATLALLFDRPGRR